MAKIRTLVVDDEPLARRLIRNLLANDPDIEIVGECDNGRSGLKEIQLLRPDLVLLDVQMPELSGLDMLERLNSDCIPYIIFVTAYDQYAIRAFEFHALDFLIKPIQTERFIQAIMRAKQAIDNQELSDLANRIFLLAESHGAGQVTIRANDLPSSAAYAKSITIQIGRRWTEVKFADILWVEAASQYIILHTRQGNYSIACSLKAFLEKLDSTLFFRIHRSTIVNASFVRDVIQAEDGSCWATLSTGERLKLSRRRRSFLKQLLKVSV